MNPHPNSPDALEIDDEPSEEELREMQDEHESMSDLYREMDER